MWSLDTRWFYVVIAAIVMLSISAMAVSRFSQFLLMLLMFCLPFAGFGKWLFVDSFDAAVIGDQVYAGLISIGIYEFLLAGLYMSWFYRIFVTREQQLPGIKSMDIWVFVVVLTYILSIPGSIEPMFGMFSLVHLLKHVALYFYVTRNFQYRHVRWFLIAMIFAIFINTALSAYQKWTGKLVGIALDKGAGSSVLNTAYEVFRLDSTRSTGTAYDSHALGMLMGMAIQFPLVLLLRPNIKPFHKGILLSVLSMAVMTLFFCYSRTAWVATVIAVSLLMPIMFFRWRESKVLTYIGLGLLVGLIASPWMVDYIYDRFQWGTMEVLGYRYDQWLFAINLWLEKPFFGHGVGNYMEAMQTIEDFGNSSPLPVHNMYLWILCECGIFGAVAFFGLILSAMVRLWKISTNNKTLISCLSLAIVMSFIVLLIDGLINPLFREPMVYIVFWFFIAFAVLFPEFHKMEKEGTLGGDSQLT